MDFIIQAPFLLVLYTLIVMYISRFTHEVLRPIVLRESKLLVSLGLPRRRVYSAIIAAVSALAAVSVAAWVYGYRSVYEPYVVNRYLLLYYSVVYLAFVAASIIVFWRALVGKPVRRPGLVFGALLVLGLVLRFTENYVIMLSKAFSSVYYWSIEASIAVMILLPIIYFLVRVLHGRVLAGYTSVAPIVMVIGILLSLLVLPVGQALGYRESADRVIGEVFPQGVSNITLCKVALNEAVLARLLERGNWYFMLDGIVYSLGDLKFVRYERLGMAVGTGNATSTAWPETGGALYSIKVLSPAIRVILVDKSVLEGMGLLRNTGADKAILFLPIPESRERLIVIENLVKYNGSIAEVSIIRDVSDPNSTKGLGAYRIIVRDSFLPLWYMPEEDPSSIPPFTFELYLRRYAVLVLPIEPGRASAVLASLVGESYTGYLGLINAGSSGGLEGICGSSNSVTIDYTELRERLASFIYVDTSYTMALFATEAVLVLCLAAISYYSEYRSSYELSRKLYESLGLTRRLISYLLLVELLLFTGIVVLASLAVTYMLGFTLGLYYLGLGSASAALLSSAILVYRTRVEGQLVGGGSVGG